MTFLKKHFVEIVAVLIFALLAFNYLAPKGKNYPVSFNSLPHAEINIKGQTLDAWVASTENERTNGLSGTKELKNNQAMLFVFEKSDVYGFWMKDMLIPIDIIWLSDKNEVVHIEKNVSPDTFPKVFFPQRPAKLVLETQTGFSDANNLKVGDKVTIGY